RVELAAGTRTPMDPLNLSWYDGDRNWSRALNASEAAPKPHYNYYAVLLTLLIFVIVFGNVLVCMAVSRRERTPILCSKLRHGYHTETTSNLWRELLPSPILSLQVVGEWRFSRIHCDIFVTLDVMMCTASILNLCAISIDRYTAVAMPMLYNTRYSSKRRVTLMIAVVWVLSFAISCPLLFGLNNTARNKHGIRSEVYLKCSLPLPPLTLCTLIPGLVHPQLFQSRIYIVLRRRRKRVSTKRSSHVLDSDTQAPLKDKCTHPEDVKLCTVIVKSNGSFQVNKRKVEAESHIEEMEMEMVSSTSPPEKTALKPTAPSNHQLIVPVASNRGNNSTLQAPLSSPGKVEKNGHAKESHHTARVFEIHSLPNGKTRNLLKAVIRRKLSQQKEKKATQMLAIVLGVFIICWLPFFITHILNMHCDCNIPPAMYSAFTWLGYVNSAVNPIIYTTFNIEFRKAFMKILHC
ncbi:DRD2 protein, partial [Locustella ochotensis]|nr:DRD2 protein [Locustella ochotensis]